MSRILALDPGRMKCGVAVVDAESVVHKSVYPTETVTDAVRELADRYNVEAFVVGNGTGSQEIVAALENQGLPVEVVDEAYSTLKARALFFRENPPKGLRRLIPIGLLTPGRPYDDYVAVILAREFLCRSLSSRQPE